MKPVLSSSKLESNVAIQTTLLSSNLFRFSTTVWLYFILHVIDKVCRFSFRTCQCNYRLSMTTYFVSWLMSAFSWSHLSLWCISILIKPRQSYMLLWHSCANCQIIHHLIFRRKMNTAYSVWINLLTNVEYFPRILHKGIFMLDEIMAN